jgi:hypothetical protein
VPLVSRKEPDLELEGLLKRHYTTVEFFQGTMMNAVDLERVKVPMGFYNSIGVLMDRVFRIKFRLLPRRTDYFPFFLFVFDRKTFASSGESCKTSLQSSRVVTSAFLLHGILLVWCMPKMDRRYGVTLLYTIFNPASVLLF